MVVYFGFFFRVILLVAGVNLFIINSANSQEYQELGFKFEMVNDKPVPNAFVRVNKKFNYVTNEKGEVSIKLPQSYLDTVQRLCLKVKSLQIKDTSLCFEHLETWNPVVLKPGTLHIEETKVIGVNKSRTKLGIINKFLTGTIGLSEISGGEEMAMQVSSQYDSVSIEQANLYVKNILKDSIIVSVNIRKVDDKSPGSKILKNDLFHIVKEDGWHSIDLKRAGQKFVSDKKLFVNFTFHGKTSMVEKSGIIKHSVADFSLKGKIFSGDINKTFLRKDEDNKWESLPFSLVSNVEVTGFD